MFKSPKVIMRRCFVAMLVLIVSISGFVIPASAAAVDYFDPYSFSSEEMKDKPSNLLNGDIDATFATAIMNASIYRAYISNTPGDKPNSGLPPVWLSAGTGGESTSIQYVGEFFGYGNPKQTDGGLYVTQRPQRTDTDSSNSFTSTYSLQDLERMSKDAPAYIAYGHSLRELGFDDMSSPSEDGFRRLIGSIAQLVLLLTWTVSEMFKLLFALVKAFNPFQFFSGVSAGGISYSWGGASENPMDQSAAALRGLDPSLDGVLKPVQTFFGNIFSLFLDLGLTVMIPLSIVIFIAGFFLLKNQRQKAGENVKKIIVKIVFLVVGIPVIGSTYTQLLGSLDEVVMTNDDFVTYTVASTFVDFRDWALKGNLAPVTVSGAGVSGGGQFKAVIDPAKKLSAPHADMWRNLRYLAVGINTAYGNLDNEDAGDKDAILKASANGSMERIINKDTAMTSFFYKAGGTIFKPGSNVANAFDMVSAYQVGDTITADAYAAASKAKFAESTGMSDMMLLSSTPLAFSTGTKALISGLKKSPTNMILGSEVELTNNKTPWSEVAKNRFGKKYRVAPPTTSVDATEATANFWDDGGMTTSGTNGMITFTAGDAVTVTITKYVSTGKPASTFTPNAGLTTMSTFGYLASDFKPNGYEFEARYEPDAASNASLSHHYSVNMIGGSHLTRLVIFINFVVLLGGYVILAFTYIFMAAVDTILRGFDALASAVMAALGSYRSIAKFIAIICSLFLQIFVSLIFYAMLVDIMFIIISITNKIADNLVTDLLGAVTASADSTFGSMYFILSVGLSAIVTFMFVSGAVSWRKAILATLNETIDQIVGAVMGEGQLNAAAPGMGGVGGVQNTAAKQGLLAGAALLGAGAAGLGAAGAVDDGMRGYRAKQDSDGDSESGGMTDDAADKEVGASALANGIGGHDPDAEANADNSDNSDGDFHSSGGGGGHFGEGKSEAGDFNSTGADAADKTAGDEAMESGVSSGDTATGTELKRSDGLDTEGNSTDANSDANINVAGDEINAGTDSEGNANGKTDAENYDGPVTDANGNTTEKAFDANGNEISSVTTDPDGNVVGSSVTEDNGDGTRTKITKDADGVATSKVTTGTDENGNEVSETTTYDKNGEPVQTIVKTTDSNDNSEESVIDYNADGSIAKAVTKDADDNSLEIDNNPELTAEDNPNTASKKTLTNADGSKVETAYDENGNELRVTETGSTGVTTKTEFGADGKPESIEMKSPNGSESLTTFNEDGTSTETGENADMSSYSKQYSAPDANGNRTLLSAERNDGKGTTETYTASDPEHEGKPVTTTTDNTTGIVTTSVKNNSDPSDLSAVSTTKIPAEESATGYAATETVTTDKAGNARQTVIESQDEVTVGKDSEGNAITETVPVTTTTTHSPKGDNTVTTWQAEDGTTGSTKLHTGSNGAATGWSETITAPDGSSVTTSADNFKADGDVTLSTTKRDASGNVMATAKTDVDRDYNGVPGNTLTTVTSSIPTADGTLETHEISTLRNSGGQVLSVGEKLNGAESHVTTYGSGGAVTTKEINGSNISTATVTPTGNEMTETVGGSVVYRSNLDNSGSGEISENSVNASGAGVNVIRKVNNDTAKGIASDEVSWFTVDAGGNAVKGGSYATSYSGAERTIDFSNAGGSSAGQIQIGSDGKVTPSGNLSGASVSSIPGGQQIVFDSGRTLDVMPTTDGGVKYVDKGTSGVVEEYTVGSDGDMRAYSRTGAAGGKQVRDVANGTQEIVHVTGTTDKITGNTTTTHYGGTGGGNGQYGNAVTVINSLGQPSTTIHTVAGDAIGTEAADPGRTYFEMGSGAAYDSKPQTAVLSSSAFKSGSLTSTYAGGGNLGFEYTPPVCTATMKTDYAKGRRTQGNTGYTNQTVEMLSQPEFAKPGHNPNRFLTEEQKHMVRLEMAAATSKQERRKASQVDLNTRADSYTI